MLVVIAIAVSVLLLFGALAFVRPASGFAVAGLGYLLRDIGLLPKYLFRAFWRGVQHVMVRLPGPRRWHRWVAGHPQASKAVRLRLVRRRKVTPDALTAMFVNRFMPQSVRIAAVRRCATLGRLRGEGDAGGGG